MKQNPLLDLEKLGQSIWIDFISRRMIRSGELQRLIDTDGVSGVTSNPSIFEKAIAGSTEYDQEIGRLALAGKTTEQIYTVLTTGDIKAVADLLRPTYDRLRGADGYVSLEVSPKLAHDTQGTVAEARRLWADVDRPNVLIKVPATKEGLPAIRRLIGEGINVNITLLFGLQRYKDVAEAYLAGLEDRTARKLPVKDVASVASFFLSRIDVLLDPMLKKTMNAGEADRDTGVSLEGKAAIASAKLAYRIYEDIFSGERFQVLAGLGARPQRLLWASTSTKNPAYADTKYVEPLIGPFTINTVPIETLNAYRDHGEPRETLAMGIDDAHAHIVQLEKLGYNFEELTQRLEDEGVRKFIDAFDALLTSLAQKRASGLREPATRTPLVHES